MIAFAALAACTKDNPKDRTVKARPGNYFETAVSATEIGSEGGRLTVKVESNVKWTAEADELLKLDVVAGSGDGTVEIQVPANYSFEQRVCALTLSTSAELDAEGPEMSVFGRTDRFEIRQAAADVIFRVDASELKVSAPVTGVKVMLYENVGYELTCLSELLECKVVDIDDSVHELRFSFPVNEGSEAREYKALVRPLREDLGLEPIELTVIHKANITLILDCTDAGNFRYNDGSAIVPLPTTTHNQDFVTGDFWLKDHPEYLFNGSVKCWSNTLDGAKNSPVRMPRIPGYQLSIVSITYSHASSTRTYNLTDGTNILGTAKANKTLQGKIEIDPSKASGDDRYLVCTGEMCCQFILTYVSEE